MSIKLEIPDLLTPLSKLPQPKFGWTEEECRLVEHWLERYYSTGWLPDKASVRMKQLLVFELVVKLRSESGNVTVH